MKSESKKGWKRYHFVLRPSGLYYYTKEKEKVKSSKDLMCLALFNAHNIYKGIGWKKKYKAPTDFGFALKCPKVSIPGKGMKMLCAEDTETLEKWIMCCRIAKYGKKLIENYKNLIDDLAREDLDKIASTRLSFTPIASSINADKLSVGSQNGRLSRASTSSSSSGCLSDDNNGFENEFTTGTIKRKPTIKANLPLTSKTRQLIKEVDDSASRNDESNDGTLTRRSRTHSSSSNGTLKRQGSRCSFDSMKSITPSTPEEPFKSLAMKTSDSIDSGKLMSCMTDSMLSLPPPPPEVTNDCAMSASTLSLNSLPLPAPPDEVMLKEMTKDESQKSAPQIIVPQPIYSSMPASSIPEVEPIYKTILKAPPYKSPPPVKNVKYAVPPPVPQKTVSFADSPQSPPVVLRKKVCFDDQIEKIPLSPTRNSEVKPPPPVRAVSTQLTNGSPKRLADSPCNPPQDFWQDLQRVMSKKWSVAQKCKVDTKVTPAEVLGFRDYDPIYDTNINYRETSTTNWVMEHYGDALYENWNGTNNNNNNSIRTSGASNGTTSPIILRDPKNLPLSPQRRSQKPPPPVPVRTCSRLSTNSNEMQ